MHYREDYNATNKDNTYALGSDNKEEQMAFFGQSDGLDFGKLDNRRLTHQNHNLQ